MKICKKCGEQKPVTEFGKHAIGRDGLRSVCRECNNNSFAEYYAENPEKVNAATAKWRANNPEKERSTDAKWRAENPEKVKAAKAKYRSANLESFRIYEQNRRSLQRGDGGKLSVGLSERLYELQRGKCACGCKQPLGDNYHLDHRMPLALGGANEDSNIQLLRATCNLQKNAKHPVDFMQQRGFLL